MLAMSLDFSHRFHCHIALTHVQECDSICDRREQHDEMIPFDTNDWLEDEKEIFVVEVQYKAMMLMYSIWIVLFSIDFDDD